MKNIKEEDILNYLKERKKDKLLKDLTNLIWTSILFIYLLTDRI